MKLNPFKKLLTTVTLIGAMTALLGCSQSEASSKLEGTPEHPYTIIWYMIGTPQADQEMVMDKLNEYLIQKIGAKVELHIIDWG
jgi:putative aldouronate transport system substrate-binding protein